MSGTIDFDDIFEAYKIIAKQNGSGACFKESLKGAAKAGGAAFAGSAIFGPMGMVVGGIAGTLYGHWTAESYDSLYRILMNMSEGEKRKLVRHMVQAFTRNGGSIRDGAALLAMVKSKDKVSLVQIQKFLGELQQFTQQIQASQQ